ncbi:MAG: D-alanyl-D-alanine carboxypeptidase [Actinomycetota bacterium]|nr:D-alanyl-D-alanine carboxypeptidase [Actinomycetota bacterium]
MNRRHRRRSRLAVVGLIVWAGALLASIPATAFGWVDDQSGTAIPHRPSGLQDLIDTFGGKCSNTANAARSYWPSQSARGSGGYVYVDPYIARNVEYNIRGEIDAEHKNNAVDYGVYGYACREISGSTSWSTHAWGAAVDTNSARNPMGQGSWDGRGSNGADFGTYLPDIWKGADPGHFFYWGLNFSRPDPMHFQYVTNY